MDGFAPILGITEIACALICLRKYDCSSFFYHADQMSCVPSMTRHFNSTLLDRQDGYKYYVPYCGRDWELMSGRCYYFEYTKKTYKQAQRNCLEKGGYLAKTDSNDEHDLFVSLSNRGSFWVGGQEVNGSWIWQDGSPISSYYWANEQPNGYGPCVHQWKGREGLDDTKCGYAKYSLCEM